MNASTHHTMKTFVNEFRSINFGEMKENSEKMLKKMPEWDTEIYGLIAKAIPQYWITLH